MPRSREFRGPAIDDLRELPEIEKLLGFDNRAWPGDGLAFAKELTGIHEPPVKTGVDSLPLLGDKVSRSHKRVPA